MGERIEKIISAVGQSILLAIACSMTGLLVYSIQHYRHYPEENTKVICRDVDGDGIEDIVIQETVYPLKQAPNVREKVFYGADIEGERVYLTKKP